MPQFAVTKSPNIDFFFNALTSDQISKMSGGRIPKMTKEQAAGLIGSWIVETGRPALDKLDVIEKGAGAGRGLSQYTDIPGQPGRRTAYEQARAAHVRAGGDPNDPKFQLQHFVNEYTGKYDKVAGGNSLIGWTRVFENAPAKGTPAFFAQYFTGSAAEGKGYFRPEVPHTASRQNAAQQVMRLYGAAKPAQVQSLQASPAGPSQARPGVAGGASRPGVFDALKIPRVGTGWGGFF